jgi:hypothetical protein
MIAFKDFAPQQTSPPGLLKAAEFESLVATVAAANAWIDGHGIDVVYVETVVLPNVWSPHSSGTDDPNQILQGGFAEAWNQFVRVWYRVKP